MILTDLRHKIKSLVALLDRKDLYTAIIITITAILAYILGILSVMDKDNNPVTIKNSATLMELVSDTKPSISIKTTTDTSNSISKDGMYVGSKSSNKYHLPSCAGAQRISEKNKIWFANKAEAEKASYTPAVNCPGI